MNRYSPEMHIQANKRDHKTCPRDKQNLGMRLARKWDGEHLLAYSRMERGGGFVLLNRSQIAEKPECGIFGPRVVAGKNGIFGMECVILEDKHSRRFPPDCKRRGNPDEGLRMGRRAKLPLSKNIYAFCDAIMIGPQPKNYAHYFNPDGGLPYTPGNPSFSEPTLLMLLAFIAAGEMHEAQPLIHWALQNRNSNGSIGLNRDFPSEGLWNTPLLAIALHHLHLKNEKDSGIDFILNFRSLQVESSPNNDVDTSLVGWSWVPQTFGWVEPTAWALLALALAGKSEHPRSVEGRRLLENRCIREGGWNYGNKVVFNHTLMPFWDTTALALLALGDSNPELRDRNLELLEKSLPEIHSLLSTSMVCLCLAKFGRETKEIRNQIVEMLASTKDSDVNLAHSALGIIALSQKRVLTP